MSAQPKFLVIESNPDARLLICNTLRREFGTSAIQLCDSSAAATLILASDSIDAVVAHCSLEHDGLETIRSIRRLHTKLPIIVIASFDFRDALLNSGANAVVTYDVWFTIGKVIRELLPQSPN